VAEITWTDDASRGLDEVFRYIARDSEVNAGRMVARIIRTAERLEQFPRSGRVVPEIGSDDVREVIAAPYRVIYRIESDTVRILAVQHSARRLGHIPGVI